MDVIREMVSKKKLRYKDEHFNLDLSYVTDRIIAMGYPASGKEGIYRNNWKDVKKFLDSAHSGHYKLYNLCSERQYDKDRFYGRVAEYPFDDHSPPPFEVIEAICADIDMYLDESPENIVAVHCKAGKGRTGTIIACFLLHSGKCRTHSEALQFFAFHRTKDQKGVTIPSQRRYVQYFDQHLKKKNGPLCNPVSNIIMDRIVLSMVPEVTGGEKVSETWLAISRGKKCGFTTTFECDGILVSGDVHIEFFNKKFTKGLMFDFWFHTQFIFNDFLLLTKADLDKACKDKTETLFPANFKVEVYFKSLGEQDEKMRRPSSAIAFSSQARSAVETAKLKMENNGHLPPVNEESKERSDSTYASIQECSACLQQIDLETNSNVYRKDGLYYHWECLKCTHCGGGVQDDFLMKENALICLKCDTGFFDHCHRCQRALKTEHTNQEGKMWHVDCYAQHFEEQKRQGNPTQSVSMQLQLTPTSREADDDEMFSDDVNYNFMTLTYNELNDRTIQRDSQIMMDIVANGSRPTTPTTPTESAPSAEDLLAKLRLQQENQAKEQLRKRKELEEAQRKEQEERTLRELAKAQAQASVQPICEACDMPLGTQATVSLGRSVIHQSCYCCCVCQSTTPKLIFQDSCVYCATHYEELFGNKCSVCSQRLVGQFFKLSTGKQAHADCLKCKVCGCNFKTEAMIERDDFVFCRRDYDATYLPRCGRCSESITSQSFSIGGRQYHSTCLRCVTCDAQLSGNQIFVDTSDRMSCRQCLNIK